MSSDASSRQCSMSERDRPSPDAKSNEERGCGTGASRRVALMTSCMMMCSSGFDWLRPPRRHIQDCQVPELSGETRVD
eukprot:3613129-Rhodomonas_salina.1